MRGFAIIDRTGSLVPIDVLNKEVCDLVGPKFSWYDMFENSWFILENGGTLQDLEYTFEQAREGHLKQLTVLASWIYDKEYSIIEGFFMDFQILDAQGKPVSYVDLDKEVRSLMGLSLDYEPHVNTTCRLGRREEFPSGKEGDEIFARRVPMWYHAFECFISNGLRLDEILDLYRMRIRLEKAENLPMYHEDIERFYSHTTIVLETWIAKGYSCVRQFNVRA